MVGEFNTDVIHYRQKMKRKDKFKMVGKNVVEENTNRVRTEISTKKDASNSTNDITLKFNFVVCKE